MINLQQDLIRSQQQVLQLLNKYQKDIEDNIQSNYNTQLYNILQCIDSFDHHQIQQLENNCKDQKVGKYIRSITQKIINNKENLGKKNEENQKQIVEIKKKQQTKPKQKKSQNKNEVKKGGFLDFVMKKIGNSKQKKTTQMILPDDEPKCHYDPVTKSWIFEGEQPTVPKTIPKPPSSSQKRQKQQIKQKQNDSSQLSQLTAPPSFKRKSTSGVKNKVKIIKEVEQVVSIVEESLTFSRMIQLINQNYANLLEKNREGAYERCIQVENNSEMLTQFTSFAQKTLLFSQQIRQKQHLIIQKWSRTYSSESRQLKILQKIITELSESANVYHNVLEKIQNFIQIPPPKPYLQQNIIMQKEQMNIDLVHRHQQQIESLKIKIQSFKSEIQLLKQDKKDMQNQLERINLELHQKYSMMSILHTQNQQFKNSNIKLIKNHTQQSHKYQSQISSLTYQLQKCNNTIQQLHNKKQALSSSLSQQKLQTDLSINKLNNQLSSQKTKIQTILHHYQQKQIQYINSLNNLYQHQYILQKYQSQLKKQNQLLQIILQSKTHKSTQQQNTTNNIISPQKSLLFQLTDIITYITSIHLDRLSTFNFNYNKLQSKYSQSKQQLNKNKSFSSNQNINLYRSIVRLKSTIQIYKQQKQQIQQRCSYLQLENDKLRKKLQHYREQDQFNKSYLSKLKILKINTQNQNFISLQQDKDQLVSQVDDLHKEIYHKNQSLKKTQTDLEDLLINFEKNQMKLLEIQRKYKEKQREIKQNKTYKEQVKNKIKLLQLKLQNQKERYDQIKQREENRIKNVQNSFEKKLKIIQNQLEQSYEREKQLEQQIQQTNQSYKIRINLLQQNHINIQNQLNKTIKIKQEENQEIHYLLSQSNRKITAQNTQKQNLLSQNKDLFQIQVNLSKQLSQAKLQIQNYKRQQSNMNTMIENLMQKYTLYKTEQQQTKIQYNQKFHYLTIQLQQSQNQCTKLLTQITQYQHLIKQLNNHIHHTQQQAQKYHLLHNTTTNENQSLTQSIRKLQQQNRELQQTLQKLSQDMCRIINDKEEINKDKIDLQQKFILQQRQIQTLRNDINKKSQELMVKTEEFLEKDRILLEIQQRSVTTKEQFDQIKNQLENYKRQIQQKEIIIEKLRKKEQNIQPNCEENQVLKERVRSLTQDLQQKFSEIQNISSSQHIKTVEIQRLNNTISNLDNQFIQLNDENNKIKMNIEIIHQKLTQKQSQIQLLLSKIQSIQQEGKQIQQNDQIQNQMSFLLKQIQQKDEYISKIRSQLTKKDHCINDLIHKNQINQQPQLNLQLNLTNANQKITLLENQNKYLQSQLQECTDSSKLLIVQKFNLQKEILSLKHDKIQLQQKIIDIQKSIQQQNQIQIILNKQVTSRLNEQQSLVNELIDDIHCKQISEQNSKTLKRGEQNEENMKIIDLLRKDILIKVNMITDLQAILIQMMKTIGFQRDSFDFMKNMVSDDFISDETLDLQQNNNEIIKLNDRLLQIKNEFKQKQLKYKQKIQKLEEDIIKLTLINNSKIQLQQNYKALIDQNTALTNQKVELMKSNDYLVAMNQKLVAGKGYQNLKQTQKAKSQIIPPSTDIKQQISKPKIGSNIDPQSKLQPKGFFGTLSSLFLTPTQSQKLIKK